jgi:hypothetical protein
MKVLMTTLSYTAIAAAVASSLVEAKSHDDKALALREGANKQITVLHEAKVVIGRKGKCSVATAFYDGLITGGWAKGTAANYLTTFRDAVSTGKPVTDWNPNRKGAKGKKNNAKAKGSKAFADLFRPSFNHDSGKTFQELCEAIENDFNDAKVDTLYEGFVEYFKAQGDEIAE